METILSISYIFAQLSAKESLWWILPKSLSPRSVEILKVDLNGKHYHFPLPDCRRQPRGWVWKKPGLYPRSCEGNYLLLTSHYCFQLKAIRELFFLWANTRGVLGCQGRDQILLFVLSPEFGWGCCCKLFGQEARQGQAASEEMTWPLTCQSLLGSLPKTLQPPD